LCIHNKTCPFCEIYSIYKVYEINLQYIPIIFAKSEIFVNILKKGFKILD